MEELKVVELYQHHLEAYEDAYWNAREKIKRQQIGRSTDEGLILRAAFAAGWFGDKYKIDVEERVKNMTPRDIVELATKANNAREVARAIDPFSLWRLATMSLAGQTLQESYARLGALKAGEALAVTVGEDGKLEILNDTTMPSISTTPVTDINEPEPIR